MSDKQIYFDTLVLLQTFETYWAYYSISDGMLYSDASRKSSNALVASLRALSKIDDRILDSKALSDEEDIDIEGLLQRLENWGNGNDATPFENMFLSIRNFDSYFRPLKTYIIDALGLSAKPHLQVNREELMFREGVVRWQAHLPTMLVLGTESPLELLKKASSCPSIVVVGSFKRYHELMTYAKDQHSFTSFMVQFIERTRMLVDEYLGIFDKFTWNGFIAYFNQGLCDITKLDMVDCFINFAKKEMEFAETLFREWSSTLRKLPRQPIGLSIGADIGNVLLQDLASQLLSVGKPIIWSIRLSETADVGEVLVNNLLYRQIQDRPDIDVEEKVGATSSGEEFITGKVTFESSVPKKR